MTDRETKKAARFHFFDEYYDRARKSLGLIGRMFARDITRPESDGDLAAIALCAVVAAGGLVAGAAGVLVAGAVGAGVIGGGRIVATAALKKKVKEEMNRDLTALTARYAAENAMPEGLKRGFEAVASAPVAVVSVVSAPRNEHDGFHL